MNKILKILSLLSLIILLGAQEGCQTTGSAKKAVKDNMIMDIKKQAEERMGLSRKQMEAVNKVYKRYKVKYDKKIDLEKK